MKRSGQLARCKALCSRAKESLILAAELGSDSVAELEWLGTYALKHSVATAVFESNRDGGVTEMDRALTSATDTATLDRSASEIGVVGGSRGLCAMAGELSRRAQSDALSSEWLSEVAAFLLVLAAESPQPPSPPRTREKKPRPCSPTTTPSSPPSSGERPAKRRDAEEPVRGIPDACTPVLGSKGEGDAISIPKDVEEMVKRLQRKWEEEERPKISVGDAWKVWHDKGDILEAKVKRLTTRLYTLEVGISEYPPSDRKALAGSIEPTVYDLCEATYLREISQFSQFESSCSPPKKPHIRKEIRCTPDAAVSKAIVIESDCDTEDTPTEERSPRSDYSSSRSGSESESEQEEEAISDLSEESDSQEEESISDLSEESDSQEEEDAILVPAQKPRIVLQRGGASSRSPQQPFDDLYRVNPGDSKPVFLSSFFTRRLKDFQKEAVRFVWNRIVTQSSGCILADEMGLGKTVVSLAMIDTYLSSEQGQKVLVIFPSAVATNWDAEVLKWLEDTQYKVLKWGSSAMHYVPEDEPTVILVTFDIFKKVPVLQSWPDFVVADEAHLLKNDFTQRGEAARKIATPRRLCLTGWPLQNKVAEFGAMAAFAVSDCLPEDFEDMSSMLDKVYQSRRPGEDNRPIVLLTSVFNRMLAPFVMRRRSVETLPQLLPAKHEVTLFCRLSPLQKDLYDKTLQWLKAESATLFQVDSAMMQLLNHPAAVTKSDGELPAPLKDVSSAKDHDNPRHGIKVLIVREIVRAAAKRGEKVLVFSRFLSTLAYMSRNLPNGTTHLKITGDFRKSQRRETIAKFTSDPSITTLLLSIRATSLGLNLSAANHVVLMDREWNPIHEIQAATRVYRIGQTREAFVYRLVAAGTIDSRMYDQQLNKESVSRMVLDLESCLPPAAELRQLNWDFLGLHEPAVSSREPLGSNQLEDVIGICQPMLHGYATHDTLLGRGDDSIMIKGEDDEREAERLFAELRSNSSREKHRKGTME